MAKAEVAEESTPEQGSGVNRKKLLILGGVLLALILISVAGTMVALSMFSGAEEEMLEADMIEQDSSEAAVPKPAIYFPIKPAIIVNFESRGRQRFLQAEITLMTRDEATVRAIELHMPMIRNSLVMLFGGQVYDELQTPEGKDALRAQALTELQAILQQEIGKAGIEQVLFTDFVMQ